MYSPKRGILAYAVFLIDQRRRRITPASPGAVCQVCGERLRRAVELMARRHVGCRSRPVETT
jgi:hypothetical protein